MNSIFFQEIKRNYTNGGATVKLILWNVILFIILQLLQLIARFSEQAEIVQFLYDFFSLSTDWREFLYKPWGLITSIFAHFHFFHFLFNMLMLYFSGQLFEQFFNARKLLILYFLGGISGGLFEILAHTFFPNFFPVFNVLGASGAIMAIFIALAFYRPNMEVNLFGVFKLKLIYLALFYLFYEIVSIGVPDGTAHFAHIGGAFMGWLAIRNSLSPTNILNVIDVFIQSNFKKKIKIHSRKNVYKTDEQFNAEKKQKQEKVDQILDKISKNGYDSLSKSEKDFLFNQSK